MTETVKAARLGDVQQFVVGGTKELLRLLQFDADDELNRAHPQLPAAGVEQRVLADAKSLRQLRHRGESQHARFADAQGALHQGFGASPRRLRTRRAFRAQLREVKESLQEMAGMVTTRRMESRDDFLDEFVGVLRSGGVL